MQRETGVLGEWMIRRFGLRIGAWMVAGALMAMLAAACGATSHVTTPRTGPGYRIFTMRLQAATWIALSYDVPVYKLPAYWLPVVFAAFQTLVLFPLLLPGHGVGRARAARAGGTR